MIDLLTLIKRSEKRILTLHPTLQVKAFELIKRAYKAGVCITISQALRTKADQDALYAKGRFGNKGPIVTRVKYPYSYHCWGLAFDFAVLTPDGREVVWNTAVDLDHDRHPDWYEVVQIGEQLGLEAGARWKNFVDVPHFQYTMGLTINDLIAGRKVPEPKEEIQVPQKPTIDGSCYVLLDGKRVDGVIINGVSYYPVKESAELLGMKVEWNPHSKTVELKKSSS